MLFSKVCGCAQAPLFQRAAGNINRRDLLCAGGAGFITAMVSTLMGSARVAHAQSLGVAVPQVDTLAIGVVVDNYVFTFDRSENEKI